MTTDDKRHPEAMSKTIRRHPEAIAKDLLPWGESRKMPFKVIDSSLGVMLLFPVFLEQHSCIHSE